MRERLKTGDIWVDGSRAWRSFEDYLLPHFLHQLGEFRNRAAETMAHRASGLNLVVNAIILWNTVYLSRAVDYIRSQGIIIPEELLSSVSPLP